MNFLKQNRKYLVILTLLITCVTYYSFSLKNKAIKIEEKGLEDYTEIIKNALSKSDHIIIKSGKYPLSAPIYLNSNTIIEGEDNTVLLKKNNYSHVFTNKSATLDYSDKYDKTIKIKNITIDAQFLGTQNDAAHKTANGHLSFKFLENLILENVKIINGDSILYGIHLQSVVDATIEEYTYEGLKDGIHINGGCKDILIEDFDITSGDDAFGIMTDDYPRVQHNTQDIENVTIRDGISRKSSIQKGFFLRFVTGSWLSWKEGNSYKIGHTVNNNRLQYKKVNGGEHISLIPPSHTSGDSTYLDNITWRFIGKGTNTSSTIKNITIKNVMLKDDRGIYRRFDDDEHNNSLYPGTEGTKLKNINIENVYLSNGNKVFITFVN